MHGSRRFFKLRAERQCRRSRGCCRNARVEFAMSDKDKKEKRALVKAPAEFDLRGERRELSSRCAVCLWIVWARGVLLFLRCCLGERRKNPEVEWLCWVVLPLLSLSWLVMVEVVALLVFFSPVVNHEHQQVMRTPTLDGAASRA
jgi:hypothetical protein